jgi:hypothetical protein
MHKTPALDDARGFRQIPQSFIAIAEKELVASLRDSSYHPWVARMLRPSCTCS